ncbi:ABC transporter permease [Labilibacter marinus]|uniref:ABC transporter permease n=1 Tax=Labilibacter marinus TaxID=1477105 RepID=UPI000833042D|nr:ABC transporter permease [Labilibacter marinus]
MNKLQPLYLVFVFLGGLLLLFIVAPLTGMVLSTSPSSFFEVVQNKEVIDSIKLTILTSFGGTLFFAFLIIPLAYLMARKEFPGKKIISGIIDLPIVIPHSAAGIAVLGFISRDSVIGKAADSVGLNLIDHPIGIALAMAFVSIPFLFNAARDGFEAVPVRLEKVALNLKASPTKTFFTISLPLASRSILSGFIMMFARGMSEFGAVVIVAYHPMITPVLVYEWFTSYGLAYARPAAVLFIAICLIFFVTLRLLVKNKEQQRHA